VRAHLFIDAVGDVPLMDEGDGLRPGQGGALALGVEGRLPPSVEGVEPLLGLALGAGAAGDAPLPLAL